MYFLPTIIYITLPHCAVIRGASFEPNVGLSDSDRQVFENRNERSTFRVDRFRDGFGAITSLFTTWHCDNYMQYLHLWFALS